MESSIEIPCCIEAPSGYAEKAKYALNMLLFPLGLEPIFVQRHALVSRGLYYGGSKDALPENVVRIGLSDSTVSYFDQKTPYQVNHVTWRFWENERWPILFVDDNGEDDFIASSFYWLSGWQEYTVTQRDIHGRFPFAASLQAKLNLGSQPVVDAYRERLGQRLQKSGIEIRHKLWSGKRWAFCPTHDIDYLRKWRPGMVYREIVHYLLANHLNQSLPRRISRFFAFLFDWVRPGDAFRKALIKIIEETHSRQGKGTYFFKAGAHGPRDVHYSLSTPFVKKVFKRLKELGFEIGLHPSYFAYDHPGYIGKEKELLEAASGRVLQSVRHHYLRYNARITTQLHLDQQFSIDSTVAFADHEGFRRGTCVPFQLFEISENKVIDIWEMPLCLMDGTIFNYRHMNREDAWASTIDLMDRCKRFGGVCVGLWHNMLWDEMDFPGWGDHFIRSLDHAVDRDAYISSLEDSLNAYLSLRT